MREVEEEEELATLQHLGLVTSPCLQQITSSSWDRRVMVAKEEWR